MKKTKYLLFLLFMLTICVVNVKSIIIVSPTGTYDNYGVHAPIKGYKDKKEEKDKVGDVYCSEFYKNEPAAGTECTVDSGWDKTSTAARVIGEIINSTELYSTKEVAINYYLGNHGYKYADRSGVKIVEDQNYCSEYKSYICMVDVGNYIKDFVSEIETRVTRSFNNESIKITSTTKPEYNIDDEMFYITVELSGVNGREYDAYFEENNNFSCKGYIPEDFNGDQRFKIRCKYNGKKNEETLKFTVKIRNSGYTTSIRYNCDTPEQSYQKIFTSKTYTVVEADHYEIKVNTAQQACNNKIEGKTRAEKVKIYKEYKLLGYDWRKILDFRNSSCRVFETNYKMTQTCNNIDINVNDFGWYNVSGYQETTAIGDKTAYCIVEFHYKNELPRSGAFDAGKIIFQDLEDLGKGYLQKRCYAYGDDTSADWQKSVDFDVSSYIKGMSILDQELEQSITGPEAEKNVLTDGRYEFIVRYNLQYLKLNYLEKVNGLATTKEWCNKNEGGCIERKGIVTRFEDEKDNNATYAKSFYPEVTLAGKYAEQSKKEYKPEFKVEKSDNCNYIFNKQMIKNNEPNLVFRIIDTKNPFSGKAGNGRVIGSNWCEGGYACTSEGIEDYSGLKLIQDNIINKPNSSGLNSNGTKATPKYTINLNYDTMKSIREYNKKHNYNSFEQECDETKKCSSKFIKEYLK